MAEEPVAFSDMFTRYHDEGMVVDTEAHVFERAGYPALGMASHYRWHEHSGDLLVAEMDTAGVDIACICGTDEKTMRQEIEKACANPDDFIMRKEYYWEAARKHADRLKFFPNVDLSAPDVVAILRADFEAGAHGIGEVAPAFSGWLPDDERMHAVWRLCADYCKPVIITFEGWFNWTQDYSEYLGCFEKVVRAYPQVNFLICHMGAYNWSSDMAFYWGEKNPWKWTDLVADFFNRHFNVAGSIGGITWMADQDFPYPLGLAWLQEMVRRVGAEKIAWATDWPWSDQVCKYKQAANMIRNHTPFLSNYERKMILGETAMRFLGLPRWEKIG